MVTIWLWLLLALVLALIIGVIVMILIKRPKHKSKSIRDSRPRHLRSSSNRPQNPVSNQTTIANAILATLAPPTTTTTTTTIIPQAPQVPPVLTPPPTLMNIVRDQGHGLGKWFSNTTHVVTDRLIDFKRQDYRRQAGLTEERQMIGTHMIAYLARKPIDLNKPVIVLLHGFCGDKDMWIWFAIELSVLSERYRIIIPDLPGFGDSTRNMNESYDVVTQAERLNHFIDAVCPLGTKIHLVGNSMGGNIAGRMVLNSPNKYASLTLMDSLGVGSPVMSLAGQRILAGENPLLLTSIDQFDDFVKLLFVVPPPLPSFAMKHLADKVVSNHEFNRKVFSDLSNKSDDLAPELITITIPTLIMWGDTDKVIDVSAAHLFHNLIHNSQLTILPNCGHVPMAEQPKPAAKLLSNFIQILL